MADKAKAAKMLALGSWHVYNRQTFEESVAFVNAALERGINHFDMADYWESDFKNTERFKAVMKELGRPREDYKIGLKIFTNTALTRTEEVTRFLDLLDLDYDGLRSLLASGSRREHGGRRSGHGPDR